MPGGSAILLVHWKERSIVAHPLDIFREAYAAFGRGDLDGYLRSCTESFNFHVAGGGAIAGTYRGNDGLYEPVRKSYGNHWWNIS
jgi:ketosteroid isomerase-like protein